MKPQPKYISNYIDKQIIVSKESVNNLEFLRPILSPHCNTINISPNYDLYFKMLDMKSRIHMTALTDHSLDVLSHFVKAVGDHKISHLEIKKELVFESKDQAVEMFLYLYLRLGKRWNLWVHEEGNNPSAYRGMTLYLRDKPAKFQFVIYTGESKMFRNMPSVHTEWRLKGASLIKNKIGVDSVNSFKSKNAEVIYQSLYDRFVYRNCISYQKFGAILEYQRLPAGRMSKRDKRHNISRAIKWFDRCPIERRPFRHLKTYFKDFCPNSKTFHKVRVKKPLII